MKYTFNKVVNPVKLDKELKASSIAHLFLFVSRRESVVDVFMDAELTPEQETVLNGIITAHTLTDMQEYVKVKILNAMEFGKTIMAEYGASNVLVGLSVAQVNAVMTKTAALQAALVTGSLYVALDEISKLTVDNSINMTQANIDDFRHKIQDYLGIPRT